MEDSPIIIIAIIAAVVAGVFAALFVTLGTIGLVDASGIIEASSATQTAEALLANLLSS